MQISVGVKTTGFINATNAANDSYASTLALRLLRGLRSSVEAHAGHDYHTHTVV